MTGIAFESPDPRADHAEIQGNQVDVDADLMGATARFRSCFFFRDLDGNHLMIFEAR